MTDARMASYRHGKLPHSEEVNAGLTKLEILSRPENAEIQKLFQGDVTKEHVQQAGRQCLQENEMIFEKLENLRKDVDFEGYSAILAECPFPELRSEFVGYLLEHYTHQKVALIHHYKPTLGIVSVSIRSRKDDEEVDVSELAKKYGAIKVLQDFVLAQTN